MNYRDLTGDEIAVLIRNGCTSTTWNDIQVAIDGFDVSRICSVHFSGRVLIGRNDRSHCSESGVRIESGIRSARIHNCVIGDHVLIENISGHIANYQINNDSIIHGIGTMECVGESTFGNGVRVKVLNEGGGREVTIYDELSSQIAYLLAAYRENKTLIAKLERLITLYTNGLKSDKGVIGAGSVIEYCSTIRNFRCGEGALVTGAQLLENGTLNSSTAAASYIGQGVVAKNFIVSTSAKVSANAILENVFVGQGTEIGKGFSAEHSLFFANCVAMHGEACSLFAGPYTVTHHKSTLLIASMFSFMNAGSGANQSNHMYKLGALHQGVFERGCKLASDSYVLYPTIIGSFSTILGKHTKNIDSRSLPFSYLIGDKDNTYILPGANLGSVGTYRDAAKWHKRDVRPEANRLDKLTLEIFNPLIINEITNGYQLLTRLRATEQEFYEFQNAVIKKSALERGVKLYRTILEFYVTKNYSTHKIAPGFGQWIDMGGMIISKSELDEKSKADYTNITEFMNSLNSYSPEDEQALSAAIMATLGIRQNPDAKRELESIILKDAEKEFSEKAMTGYGIFGDKQTDFKAVRGILNESEILGLLEYI